ncbi:MULTISPECIES: hypothetical protein [Mesorhizobium]|uniref:Uncharacterized protein n=2 Tax=Mesorhizobium TaxID=68287 RepID=A0A1A5J7G4_RHILI|nr:MULTISPECIES: hypothetical protein [Mesorhizobium]MBE1710658.1 hypothetical protein [Mesorhizobium japonicum]MBE1715520.1 hypothetical protein [Mesorhizobium japonicum]MUT23261.1 hypothetical protein [Mesorhizobium japonicum]MUT29972.1 hypothetical protein [Mesorhizobium japonicum]OBP68573.1 hypothetical protein BAE42_23950 [Mesorhizobium loti]
MDETNTGLAGKTKDRDFGAELIAIDATVRDQIESYNDSSRELARLEQEVAKNAETDLRRGRNPRGLDLRVDVAEKKTRAAQAELEKALKDFQAEVGDLFHDVYKLAGRQANPAIFYDAKSNSLASPQPGDQYDLVEERRALADIKQVGISNSDAVKEINRLLDHASAKRIAEEMDIVTYHSNAARLFDRVKSEFEEALRLFNLDEKSIKAKRDLIKTFRKMSKDWITTGSQPSDVVVGGSKAFQDSATVLTEADGFLAAYNAFLDYAKRYAGRVGSEFYTEASVDAFKEATREHAQRIEKQGVFQSPLTIFMGLVTGGAVALILIFLDTNLAFKNWTILMVGATIAIAYYLSGLFGQTARNNIMSDLRGTLYDSVLEKATDRPVDPRSVKQARVALNTGQPMARTEVEQPVALAEPGQPHTPVETGQPSNGSSVVAKGRRSDDYFKFEKLDWGLFRRIAASVSESAASAAAPIPNSGPAAPSSAPIASAQVPTPDNGIATRSLEAATLATNPASDSKNAKSASTNPAPSSLALRLADVSVNRWDIHKFRMRVKNGILLLGAVATVLIMSLGSCSFDPMRRQDFAFVSRTNELGSCVLERGRVLLASGGSYFVETRNGKPVTEIAKSLVLRIEPIPRPEETTRTKQGYVRIGANEPQANAMQAAAGGATPPTLGLPDCDDPHPEPTALSDTGVRVKQGLEAVAKKIGTNTEQSNPKSSADLVEAARLLAGGLKEGLEAVAQHIPESSGCPCTTSPSVTPVVMPVIISMPPAATPDLQAGPTVLTMAYTSDGKGYEIGDGGMILPVFLDPVTGSYDPAFWGKKGIDSVEKAFYFGTTSLTDPKLRGTEIRRKILKEYAASYTSCMKRARAAGAAKLKLIVEGYASEDWQAEKTDEERRNLNLFLAEGRRIAVINALEADPSLIEIENWPQQPKAFSSWSQVKADEVHGNFLFKDYGAMLEGLMKTLPQLRMDEKPMPIGFLAHTALVRIDGEVPEQCRSPG